MAEGDFQFQSFSEEPEQQDYGKLLPCPHCEKPIPQDALMCLYCGKQVHFARRPLWVVWTAIVLVIIFILFLIANI